MDDLRYRHRGDRLHEITGETARYPNQRGAFERRARRARVDPAHLDDLRNAQGAPHGHSRVADGVVGEGLRQDRDDRTPLPRHGERPLEDFHWSGAAADEHEVPLRPRDVGMETQHEHRD